MPSYSARIGRSTRRKRSSGTDHESGRRAQREKSATASTIVPTTKNASIHRYAPTS